MSHVKCCQHQLSLCDGIGWVVVKRYEPVLRPSHRLAGTQIGPATAPLDICETRSHFEGTILLGYKNSKQMSSRRCTRCTAHFQKYPFFQSLGEAGIARFAGLSCCTCAAAFSLRISQNIYEWWEGFRCCTRATAFSAILPSQIEENIIMIRR